MECGRRGALIVCGLLPVVLASRALAQAPPPSRETHLESVEYLSTIELPHRWAVDFVKQGPYLYMTGSESARQFAVIDVADPANPRVIAETAGGLYAARNLCMHGNLALVNSYQWINPIDITRPDRPEPLFGCQWRPDSAAANVRSLYRLATAGEHLFLACAKPELAFRVYRIERLFQPRLVGTLDLSSVIWDDTRRIMDDRRNYYPNAEIIMDGRMVHTSYGDLLVGIDVGDPSSPRLVYSQRISANVVGLALHGRTLYVAANSRWRSRRGLEMGAGAAIIAYDLTDPASPRPLGEYRDLLAAERMVVRDGLMYAVGAERTPADALQVDGVAFARGLRQQHSFRTSLHVIDVSDPAHMRRRSTLAFPFQCTVYSDAVCRALALDSRVIYAADHEYGVRTADVADPDHPRWLGDVRTISHEVRRLHPRGERLLVASDACIHAADVSDPQSPRLDPRGMLGEISGWGTAYTLVSPDGRYLYSINRGGFEIAISRIVNAPAAEVVRFVSAPAGWSPRALDWAGGRLYALWADERQAVNTIVLVYEPVGDGADLKHVATYPTGRLGSRVGWGLNTTFLATADMLFIMHPMWHKASGSPGGTSMDDCQLVVVDIRNRLAPVIYPPVSMASLTSGMRLAADSGRPLAYRDGHLFAYCIDDRDPRRPSHLLVFDMADPEHPVLKASLRDPAPGNPMFYYRSLCRLDPHPYLACTSEASPMWVIDIRDPANPRTAWTESYAARGSDIQGDNLNRKPPPAWQDGVLYAPRLNGVDLFKLRFESGPALPAEQHLSRVRQTLDDARQAVAGRHLPEMLRATMTTQIRAAEWRLHDNDLPRAQEDASAIERWLANPTALTLPTPIAQAPRIASAVHIDGDAAEWSKAPEAAFASGDARIRWMWDDRHLYCLLYVHDPVVNHFAGAGGLRGLPRDAEVLATPHCYIQDHVDLFITGVPTDSERPYGPADVQVSISLNGRVELHHQNPRVRGDVHHWGRTPSRRSRAAVRPAAAGYVVEAAISHEDTWLTPLAGANVACSVVVTDTGERQVLLRPVIRRGYLSVQPDWPRIELAP